MFEIIRDLRNVYFMKIVMWLLKFELWWSVLIYGYIVRCGNENVYVRLVVFFVFNIFDVVFIRVCKNKIVCWIYSLMII